MIGHNREKYLQVEWGPNMAFRDSLQFLPASLESLVASLAKVNRGYFQNLHDVASNMYPESEIQLLERKGVDCYEYVDSFARLEELVITSRKAFFNMLGDVECSQVDYAHAKHVWENYGCQNLFDNMMLYLLSDICLLADVLKAFRNQSLDEYQLDPAYFLSAAQLAWNALLKHIDRPIPLITRCT